MTDPETRLAEAAKQCELAADELPTQIQTDTARALAALIHNLGKSVERVRDIDDGELIADGGQEERLPWCAECEAFAVPEEDGTCGECGDDVVLTDGGHPPDDIQGPVCRCFGCETTRREGSRYCQDHKLLEDDSEREPEVRTDGGQSDDESRVKCVSCDRFYQGDLSDDCPHCEGSDLGQFITDGGRDRDLMALERRLDEMVGQQRRQADALEDVAEQLEIQNGILFELITELDRRNSIAMKGVPDDAQRPKSRATGVQDGVTYLAENVDVDEATRWVDE